MKQKTKLFRQGDVLLRRLDSMPKGISKPIPRDNGRIILAYGEVTGHAHGIDSPECEMLQIEGITVLDVKAAMAALTHEEHATIELPQGQYQVVIQREYSPEAIRRVAD